MRLLFMSGHLFVSHDMTSQAASNSARPGPRMIEYMVMQSPPRSHDCQDAAAVELGRHREFLFDHACLKVTNLWHCMDFFNFTQNI